MINSACAIDNKPVHPDFFESQKFIFDACKLICSKPEAEKESAEYGACTFKLNNFNVIFRVAKTTPTKPGLFFTVWKTALAN